MTGSCIAVRAARPEAVSSETQARVETRRDGWQQFQARTLQEIRQVIDWLHHLLCLERYSVYDRDRLQAALEESSCRFFRDGDPSASPRVCLGVLLRADSVQVTLENLEEGTSPADSHCEAGILFKGFQLRWAHYRKIGSRLQLTEYSVFH